MTDSMQHDVTPKSALEIIHEAWKDGRPIVPFFGAGISVGAGFPLTGELREYFCKVLFYIRKGGYRIMLGQSVDEDRDLGDFDTSPSSYLASFGWPDFYRINADLFQLKERLRDERLTDPSTIDNSKFGLPKDWVDFLISARDSRIESKQSKGRPTDFPTRLLNLCNTNSRHGTQTRLSIDKVRVRASERRLLDKQLRKEWASLRENLPRFLLEFSGKRFSQQQLSEIEAVGPNILAQLGKLIQFADAVNLDEDGWASGASWLEAIVQSEILAIMDLEDSERVRTVEPQVWSRSLRLRMDWFRLLLELVEGRMGLADLLFSDLNKEREPSDGHIAIAHLSWL